MSIHWKSKLFPIIFHPFTYKPWNQSCRSNPSGIIHHDTICTSMSPSIITHCFGHYNNTFNPCMESMGSYIFMSWLQRFAKKETYFIHNKTFHLYKYFAIGPSRWVFESPYCLSIPYWECKESLTPKSPNPCGPSNLLCHSALP